MDIQEMRIASFTAGGCVLDSGEEPVEGAEVALSLDGGVPAQLDDLFHIFEMKRANDNSFERLSGPDGESFVELKR